MIGLVMFAIFAAIVLYGIVMVAVIAGMMWVTRDMPYTPDTVDHGARDHRQSGGCFL